ncbi:GNAT family N-acetyltransferase [Algoriphagus litoralis]|uniref:GNAT family N-acetyltransferase n=1 Tax=Algoriphagus litoralis TaxID=2202829 RepID=UPI000DB9EF47|nr:GNAT family N-acetyltransferase [Algoriphagus litoralis]
MTIYSRLKSFHELTVDELYQILKLRTAVFVVEQNCVFQDMDDKDQKCYHLMMFQDDLLVGYSRLVPAGLSYAEMAIGRVITASSVRGTGLGKKLMEFAIDYCQQLLGPGPIRIGAQTYALGFYASLGFVADGDTYDEDGIEHVEMVKIG